MSIAETPPATSHHSTAQYAALQEENRQLRIQIRQLEQAASAAQCVSAVASQPVPAAASPWSHGLTAGQISRYSRQLLLSELGGADTQARLLRSRVLVVGAGGLGAPVCLYLAAAGVGHLTIVDGDEVELSNLHRQVIHTEASVGEAKVRSAARAVRQLNSDVQVTAVVDRFTESNALALAQGADLLIDASDNVATRYLVNDVGVVLGKPVVSGSALRMEGQVSIFHLGGGPCYRCLYPTPPPPSTVTNCSDGGVLGAITGIIGSIQALEVVKILAGLIESPAAAASPQLPLSAASLNFSPVAAASTMTTLNSKLLLFDGCSSSFRSVKLRPRNLTCAVCGDSPTITKATLEQQSLDYQMFCGSANHDGPAAAATSSMTTKVPTASVVQLYEVLSLLPGSASAASSALPPLTSTALLLDVREPVQFRICALPGAINVPLRVLKQQVPTWLLQRLRSSQQTGRPQQSGAPLLTPGSAPAPVQSITPHPTHPLTEEQTVPNADTSAPTVDTAPLRDIFVMCRRGIDSVKAARLLLQAQAADSDPATQALQELPVVRHVAGGLQAWQEKIDVKFPLY